MTATAQARQDCEAQLVQVRGRLADALNSQRIAARYSPSTQRIVADRLRGLQRLEAEILADLAQQAA